MQVLRLDGQMQELAKKLKHESSLLVFGRGYNYATALEAALKVLGTFAQSQDNKDGLEYIMQCLLC